jgi:hypothetical protein
MIGNFSPGTSSHQPHRCGNYTQEVAGADGEVNDCTGNHEVMANR